MSQLQQREDTLIVVHQSVLSLLLATWLGGPVAAMWHFPFSHDAYTVVEDRGGYWVLRVFNGRSVWQTENLGELYCIVSTRSGVTNGKWVFRNPSLFTQNFC